jgi:diguanylate cyclase (GGDEF)-like protein
MFPELSHAFQPIISFSSGDLFGCEALLRNSHLYGLNDPGALFDLFHEQGILGEMTRNLLDRAAESFLCHSLPPGYRLFYNLDNRLFDTDKLPGFYLVQPPGCPTIFEISEKHRLVASDRLVEALEDLKKSHCLFALDDYGTGFSGLELLYHTKPEFIKIDRFFIGGIDRDHRKKLFTENVVTLAHALGIRIIAEGIETRNEYVTCQGIGCDFAQGYYIQRPESDIKEICQNYSLTKSTRLRRENREQLSQSEMQDLVTKPEPVTIDNKGLDILKRFKSDQTLTHLPVTDTNGFPLGVIREKDLKSYVYTPYGISIFQKRLTGLGLESFMATLPVTEISTPVNNIIRLASTHTETDALLLVRNGRYYGILDYQALIQLVSRRDIIMAREQNPLTRLPGNYLITRHLNAVFKNREGCRLLVYFDFNDFKPFNDTYGFRNGDRAILLFSDILRKSVNLTRDFIGHIGGDDFVLSLAADTESPDRKLRQVEAIRDQFRIEVMSYYTAKDRDAGYIDGCDRFGTPRRFPLLTVSAICVRYEPHGPSMNMAAWNDLIAEKKHLSKELGLVYHDQTGN